jgi:hypothetical protein
MKRYYNLEDDTGESRLVEMPLETEGTTAQFSWRWFAGIIIFWTLLGSGLIWFIWRMV